MPSVNTTLYQKPLWERRTQSWAIMLNVQDRAEAIYVTRKSQEKNNYLTNGPNSSGHWRI